MYTETKTTTGNGIPFTCSAALYDEDGDFLTTNEVSSVTFSIYEKNGNSKNPVQNFMNVSVQVSDCIIAPVYDRNMNCKYRNFRHTLPVVGIFPNKDKTYYVDYRVYLTNGQVAGWTVVTTVR